MAEISALLIHRNSDALHGLSVALAFQSIRVMEVQSCAQARRMLGELIPPPLVFTDTELPDGTWADILGIAQRAACRVNVIVVSRVVNTRFYVETIEAGAFDFIVPPFNANDLNHVVRCVADKVATGRATRSCFAQSLQGCLDIASVGCWSGDGLFCMDKI